MSPENLQQHLLHFGTGGLSHMLRLLGNSIQYCQNKNITCIPLLANNRAFAVGFHTVFDSKSIHIADEQTCDYCNTLALTDGNRIIPVCEARLKNAGAGTGVYFISQGEDCWTDIFLHLDSLPQLRPLPATVGTYSTKSPPLHSGWDTALQAMTVKPYVNQLIASAYQSIPQEYIGVHYRNTDMTTDFTETCNTLAKALNAAPGASVYWATDDAQSVDRARRLFDGIDIKNLARLPNLAEFGARSLHYTSEKTLREHGITKLDQIVDALIDIFLLSRSRFFVASPRSSLSRLVSVFRKDSGLIASFFNFDQKDKQLPSYNHHG